MDMKMAIVASVLAAILLVGCVCSAPLDEQLPDTTGLFFGKRNQHPNMNSLLFGRRSYSSVADQLPDTTGLFFGKRGSHPNMNGLLFGKRNIGQEKFDAAEAQQVCKAVKLTCDKWGLGEN